MNRRRLYRCRYDRQLAGVAGGIAEYLDVDPTLVRLLWIVSIVFGGVTILLYVLMAFIVPLEPVGYGALTAPFGGPVGPAGFGPAGLGPAVAAAAAGEGGTMEGTGAEGEGAPGEAAAGRGFAGEGSVGEGSAEVGGGARHPAGQTYVPDPHALWATHGGAVPVPHGHTGGGAGGALLTVFGVLLVVFGAIALLGPMVPGWVGSIHLGPAFVLALGIALLAASIRRPAPEPRDQ